MLRREDLYAYRCVEDLIQIIEQVPPRAAARRPIVFDDSSVAMPVLWTILRWERTWLLKCLEEMGVDMWDITCELDALIDERGTSEALPVGLVATAGSRQRFVPPALDRCLWELLHRARAEATALQQDYVGTEHVLLAVIAGADARLSALLSNHGITHESVKAAVLKLLAEAPQADAVYVAQLVRPADGPAGARWDTPAVGVPQRFAVGVLMLLVTMYAFLFAAMQWLGAHPIVFTMVAVLFSGVGLGQMFLFGGKYPRAASIWVGACLLPVEVLAMWIYMAKFDPRLLRSSGVEGMLCFLIFSIPLGAFFGYLAGGLTAGVFFLIEKYRKTQQDETMKAGE